jgi:hypothetical protein
MLGLSLPPRFSRVIREIQKGLELLFGEGYPMVLSHPDMNEMNFLVDPETGNLTGVVDWEQTTFKPFGLSLWTLGNLLGSMDLGGWHDFHQRQELESLFWEIFRKRVGEDERWEERERVIRLGRNLGTLLRYGRHINAATNQGLSVALKFLDALLIRTRRCMDEFPFHAQRRYSSRDAEMPSWIG